MWRYFMNVFRTKKSATIAELLVAKKLVVELSCVECTGQRNDFELIPMVKMKTRHPTGSFAGWSLTGKIQGILKWSGKTIIVFCRPARANTLNSEIVLAFACFFLIWQYHNYTSSLALNN